MAFHWTATERVNASPDTVFAIASDFPSAPQRISGIKRVEMLTQGPVRVGTKFREWRAMLGREMDATMEVADFQPGCSYTLVSNSAGCEFRSVVSVRPVDAAGAAGTPGSEISFAFSSTPLSYGAKLVDTIMGWMFKNTCIKAAKQDLMDIKTAVEKTTGR